MNSKRVSRRKFIKSAALGVSGLAVSGFSYPSRKKISPFVLPYLKNSGKFKKVIILGMDGMDPGLLRRFVAEGEMPTFKRYMESNHFGELQTTMPPHSPVAWSSFITGTNPGGHAIFDFVHRDPKTFTPYMSTSRSFDTSKSLSIGNWNVPLGSGRVELMRKSTAFWSVLEDYGIDASLYALPANFPVVDGSSKTVSGMGTPDLLGTYGTFTYFTDADVPDGEHLVGGRVVPLKIKNHTAQVKLVGPKNSFKSTNEFAEIDVSINRDPFEEVLKINIQDHELFMKKGEWSDWVPLKFGLLPMFVSLAGMVRFYVKEVHPHIKIYVSPINIDPADPILPICSPSGYSKELTQAVGRFYTQGFPADSKALSQNVLSDDEYLMQSKSVIDESFRIFEHQFKQFTEGCFFFYFSSVDQNCHMLWRNMDPTHPLYVADASPDVKNGVRFFYRKMDEVLKMALAKVDSNTLFIILSDHGFSPFTREFHVSSWLVENGFTTLTDSKKRGEGEFYQYVDWEESSAYALGLNGIYINLQGREPHGWVTSDEAEKIKHEIVTELRKVRDPVNGNPVITNVYYPHEIYSGPFVNLAPDLVVGYQRGYRISDEAVLGKFPKGVIGDRTDKWAADHCLDPAVVPGVLLMNQPCKATRPGIWDLAPTILNAFGIQAPPQMTGQIIT